MTTETRPANKLACASPIDQKAMETVLALIEPTRLKIVAMLARARRMCVGDIADQFSISRPAISHHLKVLKTGGLVQTEKEGQEVYYSICRNCIVDTLRAVADAIENCCQHRSDK
ncbi:MAG: metalloregulator ArsR/SmtB family transcription factor [Acidobacteriota bacterium]